jgi:hypothetical protein
MRPGGRIAIMKRPAWLACALIAALALPALAQARPLSVEVWTNRGDEGVYDKGDVLKIGARANDDAHLLVYEIDAEGYVNLLFPYDRGSDFIEAKRTYRIPDDAADMELVVEGPTGQGYIVAVVSAHPFEPMPWYLRPYSAQAASLGYEGDPEEEEGVTTEGRIVGDPFIAMERIRRRVVRDADDPAMFATAYTTYYLHEPVKYPRYLCYDCHRPGHWSWWSGFDPYYTSCSVFTVRVNYDWHWGPSYWFGRVPYYVYSCQPGYGWRGRYWYSGWDGWSYWSSIWGGPLKRGYSSPPVGYIPPERYKEGTPPGLIAAHDRRKGGNMTLPIGRNDRPRGDDRVRDGGTRVDRGDRGGQRQPAGEIRGDEDRRRPTDDRGGIRRQPASERGRGGDDNARRPVARPAPRPEPAREAPRPREERKPDPQPEPAREQKRDEPAPPPPAPQEAPKPRDEARPIPSKGGRGGERGNRISSVDRGVPRGRLSIESSPTRTPSRDRARNAYTTPIRRSTQVMRSGRQVTRPVQQVRRGGAKIAPAPKRQAAPAKRAEVKEAPAKKAPARAQKAERSSSRGEKSRGGRNGR